MPSCASYASWFRLRLRRERRVPSTVQHDEQTNRVAVIKPSFIIGHIGHDDLPNSSLFAFCYLLGRHINGFVGGEGQHGGGGGTINSNPFGARDAPTPARKGFYPEHKNQFPIPFHGRNGVVNINLSKSNHPSSLTKFHASASRTHIGSARHIASHLSFWGLAGFWLL